jgi:hypothetical protein
VSEFRTTEYAESIFATAREAFVLLDDELRVRAVVRRAAEDAAARSVSGIVDFLRERRASPRRPHCNRRATGGSPFGGLGVGATA